jgi:monothiol glutaredoxin
MTNIFDEIQTILDQNDVVLFMKGSKDFPQCGFSATVSHILTTLGVDFKDFDILKDNEMRQAIKEFSDWPTIPQLYIKGEFIGGCDIVKEMMQAGELQTLLKEKGIIS